MKLTQLMTVFFLVFLGLPLSAFDVFEMNHNVVLNYGQESRILKLPEAMQGASGYTITLLPSHTALLREQGDFEKDAAMLMARANALFHQEKFSEAIDLLSRAEKLEPRNVKVKNMLGSVFYKLDDYEKARRYWEESLKIQEKQPNVEKYLKKLPTIPKAPEPKPEGPKP